MTNTTNPQHSPGAVAPDPSFRIDCFHVPAAARDEFVAAMRRNMAFIATLPGFRGHVVYDQTGGPSSFNLVTVATWETDAAHAAAAARVRAYYQEIGFDPAALMARLGVRAELGAFRAVADLSSAP